MCPYRLNRILLYMSRNESCGMKIKVGTTNRFSLQHCITDLNRITADSYYNDPLRINVIRTSSYGEAMFVFTKVLQPTITTIPQTTKPADSVTLSGNHRINKYTFFTIQRNRNNYH